MFASLTAIEEQLNNAGQVYVNNTDELPAGTKPDGDFFASIANGKMRLSIPRGKNTRRDLSIEDLGGPFEPPLAIHFVGRTSSTNPPTVTEFPNDGDWGFHVDTTGTDTYYIAINYAGVVQYLSFTVPPDPFINTNFLGRVNRAAGVGLFVPTVADFPNTNDWGFWHNTSNADTKIWLTYNVAGDIRGTSLPIL